MSIKSETEKMKIFFKTSAVYQKFVQEKMDEAKEDNENTATK